MYFVFMLFVRLHGTAEFNHICITSFRPFGVFLLHSLNSCSESTSFRSIKRSSINTLEVGLPTFQKVNLLANKRIAEMSHYSFLSWLRRNSSAVWVCVESGNGASVR
ncbi:hypothetical protein SEA_KEANEYLIN_73 [Arthrobacter phage KeaneyLin]|uniref:Uncharacterized protein n=1 Tax=Arthrobacter phage KeaneyLin TaxID=2250412 RepID=A0A345KMF9_9CAUD|nr:hypothetical protein PQB83_gp73 [Arthrobacter phage KeaneyLin]AXH44211.1 hypothetical protein SEA_KEANEYLIN_73 [Arthrobacter phage KeaneyLin]